MYSTRQYKKYCQYKKGAFLELWPMPSEQPEPPRDSGQNCLSNLQGEVGRSQGPSFRLQIAPRKAWHPKDAARPASGASSVREANLLAKRAMRAKRADCARSAQGERSEPAREACLHAADVSHSDARGTRGLDSLTQGPPVQVQNFTRSQNCRCLSTYTTPHHASPHTALR